MWGRATSRKYCRLLRVAAVRCCKGMTGHGKMHANASFRLWDFVNIAAHSRGRIGVHRLSARSRVGVATTTARTKTRATVVRVSLASGHRMWNDISESTAVIGSLMCTNPSPEHVFFVLSKPSTPLPRHFQHGQYGWQNIALFTRIPSMLPDEQLMTPAEAACLAIEKRSNFQPPPKHMASDEV